MWAPVRIAYTDETAAALVGAADVRRAKSIVYFAERISTG